MHSGRILTYRMLFGLQLMHGTTFPKIFCKMGGLTYVIQHFSDDEVEPGFDGYHVSHEKGKLMSKLFEYAIGLTCEKGEGVGEVTLKSV